MASVTTTPVTTGPSAGHGDEAHETSTGLSNAKVAMWAFLGSGTPTPKDVYDIPYTSVSSFVLLMSSLTMVLALAAIQRDDHHRARTWLLTTALLGSVFVGGQVYEFTKFYSEGLKLQTNLFGSSFFVLTGFHGAHVTVGVLMLLSLFGLSARGRLPKERAETVELVGLYWHFVDVVWIVIFTLIYLIPS